jgi:hypothetical protein
MNATSRPVLSALLLALAATGISPGARAQERHELFGAHIVLDSRYHHDRYYLAPGYLAERLPVGSVAVSFGPGQYFFHAGVWYRPVGARFEVIMPPVGIVLPFLPAGYVTLTIGGLPYYYANGVYYAPGPGTGYVVVTPPPGADTAQAVNVGPAGPGTAPAAPQAATAAASVAAPIIYPRNGQTSTQLVADQQQCRQWASAQPGASANPSIFDRALGACLDGRGYTVR